MDALVGAAGLYSRGPDGRAHAASKVLLAKAVSNRWATLRREEEKMKQPYDGYCYECMGYGDDYYIDDDGELVWQCPDCPYFEQEGE